MAEIGLALILVLILRRKRDDRRLWTVAFLLLSLSAGSVAYAQVIDYRGPAREIATQTLQDITGPGADGWCHRRACQRLAAKLRPLTQALQAEDSCRSRKRVYRQSVRLYRVAHRVRRLTDPSIDDRAAALVTLLAFSVRECR